MIHTMLRMYSPAVVIHSILLAALCLASGIGRSCQAQVTVNSLFPAGGRHGQTVDVTLSGSFASWPPTASIVGDGVKIAYEKDKGKAKFSIRKDASSGVRFLRWHDAKGISEWRMFVVGSLPEIVEAEPNESPLKPQSVELPVVANGRLQKSGDVDTFKVKLAAKQKLVALVEGKRIGSKMDPVLQICDQNGFVLAQNDDERGVDPLLVFETPKAGDYLVRTFCFPETPNSTIGFAGGADYVYRLTLTTDGHVDFAMPLTAEKGKKTPIRIQGWNLMQGDAIVDATGEPAFLQLTAPEGAGHVVLPVVEAVSVVADAKSSQSDPQKVTLPVSISGVVESPGDEDTFTWDVEKGDRINLSIKAFTLGFPLDPLLTVTNADGKVLKEADDQSRSERDVSTVVVAPLKGAMQVKVQDVHRFGGPRFAYALMIEKELPGFRLSGIPQSLSVVPGKEVELSINLARTAGFKDVVELSVANLPPGVSAEPIKLDAKAKTGKLKLKAAADAKPFSGSLNVVGVSGDKRRTARYTVYGIPMSSVWLTVSSK